MISKPELVDADTLTADFVARIQVAWGIMKPLEVAVRKLDVLLTVSCRGKSGNSAWIGCPRFPEPLLALCQEAERCHNPGSEKYGGGINVDAVCQAVDTDRMRDRGEYGGRGGQ